MPRLGETKRVDPAVEAALAEWSKFESGFTRSRRGNLWRHYDGVTVSVFKRSDDLFGWCIAADEDDKRFSAAGYETEPEAIEALGGELGVGR